MPANNIACFQSGFARFTCLLGERQSRESGIVEPRRRSPPAEDQNRRPRLRTVYPRWEFGVHRYQRKLVHLATETVATRWFVARTLVAPLQFFLGAPNQVRGDAHAELLLHALVSARSILTVTSSRKG